LAASSISSYKSPLRRHNVRWERNADTKGTSQVIFLISLILAVIAVMGFFTSLPFANYAPWIAIAAYVVLAADCTYVADNKASRRTTLAVFGTMAVRNALELTRRGPDQFQGSILSKTCRGPRECPLLC
jgi:hypothetical protein